jgi:sensor histidine kinase YesM
METASRFITPAILFVLTLASGIWLSSAGKPLHPVIFTLHKLIALGAVVLTAIQIYYIFKSTPVQTLVIVLVILTGVCVVALFATGAFMSIGKNSYDLMLAIHRVALVLEPIAMAAAIYLLNEGIS